MLQLLLPSVLPVGEPPKVLSTELQRSMLPFGKPDALLELESGVEGRLFVVLETKSIEMGSGGANAPADEGRQLIRYAKAASRILDARSILAYLTGDPGKPDE